ncbi:MAG TPA: hypothetical protein VHE30_18090 [Polyangiaceae bacterium]|nr:hypothetical protein [Polyangiaceae bacterium]
MNTSIEFPKVTQTDPSDVAVAIETAQALWRRGDLQESLRWVRRAAEAAENEGDDMRALSLARAAADLQEQYRPSQAPPPPAATRASAPPAARPSAVPVAAHPSAAPAQPAATSTEDRVSRPSVAPSRPSQAPSRAAEAVAKATLDIPPAPKLEPWSPPGSRAAEAAPAPAPARAEPAPSAVAPAPAPRAAEPAPASVRAERALEPTTPATPVAAMPVPEKPSAKSGEVHTALRVAVEASRKAPGTFIVRALGAGEAPGDGAFEALLVPLSADVDLRGR